jgi:hypothetical protein
VLVPNKKAKKINLHTQIRNENIGGKDRKKNKESINREKTKSNTQTLQILGIWCTVLYCRATD